MAIYVVSNKYFKIVLWGKTNVWQKEIFNNNTGSICLLDAQCTLFLQIVYHLCMFEWGVKDRLKNGMQLSKKQLLATRFRKLPNFENWWGIRAFANILFPVVNFPNILQASFQPIFVGEKKHKTKLKLQSNLS